MPFFLVFFLSIAFVHGAEFKTFNLYGDHMVLQTGKQLKIAGTANPSVGPVYEKMEREKNRIRIFFRNVGSGLLFHGQTPYGFTICGADGNFLPAEAKIQTDSILVWHSQIANPEAVRYAWPDFAGKANLFNAEGFPASSFRTDTPRYLNATNIQCPWKNEK